MEKSKIKASLKTLNIGDVWTFEPFWVKRKSVTSYCLFDARVRSRSRWGNLDEITDDIEHAIACKELPSQDMPSW